MCAVLDLFQVCLNRPHGEGHVITQGKQMQIHDGEGHVITQVNRCRNMIKLGKNGKVRTTAAHLTVSSVTSKSHMKNGCQTELCWIGKGT